MKKTPSEQNKRTFRSTTSASSSTQQQRKWADPDLFAINNKADSSIDSLGKQLDLHMHK